MQEDFSQHTPMMQQYWQVKSKYMDYILFYRLGDFYEVFYEDAQKVSKLLHLTLTKRGKSNGAEIPMAGIPHHSAESYLARLLKFGENIAICDQVGEAGKGIIQREVTRVITAGTLIEDEFLDAKVDNYLVAISKYKNKFGLAKCVLASGKLEITEFDSQLELANELNKIPVVELLADDGMNWDKDISQIGCIRYYPSWHFEMRAAEEILLNHFKVNDLSAFGCEHLTSALNATGALIYYAQSTQKNIEQIDAIVKVSNADRFSIDANSRKHLEVFTSQSGDKRHSLLAVIDKSSTNMGSRRIKNWLENPIRNKKQILDRQNAAYLLAQKEYLSRLQFNLTQIGDLERIITRIIAETAKPIDLLYLKATLENLPAIKSILQEILQDPQKGNGALGIEPQVALLDDAENKQLLLELDAKILLYVDLLELLQSSINEEAPALASAGVIKDGFDDQLDKFRNLAENSAEFLQELEEKEKRATGINGLKVGFNKIHGYYIEISRTNAQEDLPVYFTRRQTLKNAERYITPELKQFEEEILSAQSKALEREKAIYRQIVQKISLAGKDLKSTASALADLDALSGFAFLHKHFNYSMPSFNSNREIEILAARHPIVEALSTNQFIENDLQLNKNQSMWIITGANMGGKSTFMRQIALIVLLAHIGAPVPAKSANLGEIDAIYTRIGASDDLVNNKSTFMVEMSEAAYILRNATRDSLIIMDEIGRGTSTYDGLSLAYAIAEFVNKISAYCLFSTHYFELTNIGDRNANVANYNMATAKQGADLVFLYKIVAGAASQSYGLEVAKIAGVPSGIIERANKKLEELETFGYREKSPIQGELFAEETCEQEDWNQEALNIEAEQNQTQNQSEKPTHFRAQNQAQHQQLIREIEQTRQQILELKKELEAQKQITEKLKDLDINNLTPLQALEFLHNLKN